jgi:hypothetical protein
MRLCQFQAPLATPFEASADPSLYAQPAHPTENRTRGRTRRRRLHGALHIASWIARACAAVIADTVAALLTP